MKLKTLKDVTGWVDLNGSNIDKDAYLGEDLRNAAREWLVEFEEKDKKAIEELGGSVHFSVILFIKHFFGLGDE